MADYRRNEIVSGLFIVGAVAVFMLFAFRVGGADLFGLFRPKASLYRTYFPDSKTLDEGAKVAVAGRRVGSVRAMTFTDQPYTAERVRELADTDGPDARPGLAPGMLRPLIEVVFAIEDPTLKLDLETARVSLVQDGLLGRHYIALDPGYWTPGSPPEPALASAGQEPVHIRSVPVGGLDTLMLKMVPALDKVDSILGMLRDRVFNEEGSDASRRAIVELADTLANLRAMLDSGAPDGVHQMIIAPLNQLLNDTDASVNQLRGGTLTKLDALLEAYTPLADDARKAVNAATLLVDENRPHITNILRELDNASVELDSQIKSMQADLHRLLGNVNGVVTDNRAEIAEIMRRMRRTMWQAEMAMRKIRANPAYLLFGDEEADLEEQSRDLMETWRSGRARPYRQRDEGDGK